MSRASRRSATPNACPRTTRQRSWEERCRKSTSGSATAAPQSDGIAQEPATALLIVDLDKHIGNARAWRDTFGEQLPGLEIRISPDAGNLSDIAYLAFMHPDVDSLPVFPNLKAMFSRSAGIESFYEG